MIDYDMRLADHSRFGVGDRAYGLEVRVLGFRVWVWRPLGVRGLALGLS